MKNLSVGTVGTDSMAPPVEWSQGVASGARTVVWRPYYEAPKPRDWFARVLAILALGAALLALSGCSTISSEAKEQIKVEAASHLADLREWDNLDSEQKRKAYEMSAKAFATLDYSVNGTPLPPEFGGPVLERKDAPKCPEDVEPEPRHVHSMFCNGSIEGTTVRLAHACGMDYVDGARIENVEHVRPIECIDRACPIHRWFAAIRHRHEGRIVVLLVGGE